MRRLAFFFLFLTSPLWPLPLMDTNLEVNLNDASYEKNVLSTTHGGIVTAKNLFLQAQNIEYTRAIEKENPSHTLYASGDLFLTYKNKSYKGDNAYIDFIKNEIVIVNGCTQSDHFFMGGETIKIHTDGTGTIEHAYITTSETENNSWVGNANEAQLQKNNKITAQNVSFYCQSIPIFYAPSVKTSLNRNESSTPFRYRVRWGGREKLRLGITYVLPFGAWKNRFLLDYSIKFGLGGGLRTGYRNKEAKAQFETLNYLAQGKNRSWESFRYRFQGFFSQHFDTENVRVKAIYDKLSDNDMKNDFSEHAISDARTGLTQLSIIKGEDNWKAGINTRVKINSFQTVKQQLPLVSLITRPQPLGNTPLILDNQISAGYLSYRYGKNTHSVHNFASTRNEIWQKLYTHAVLSPIIITPSIGYRIIQYNNSPQHHERLQAIGILGLGLKTRFVNRSAFGNQVCEPYAEITSYTRPPIQTRRVYVFDTDDGWAQLTYLKYGLRHSWYLPTTTTGFQPKLLTDLFSLSFYKTRYLSRSPYKAWLQSSFSATPTVTYYFDGGWDFTRHLLDHCNLAVRKTFSSKLALILEYRQRSSYSWRKIDDQNFMVEAIRSPQSLRHSQMSDKRKTAIATLMYSPTPVVDCSFSAFSGFRRKKPRRYTNYECMISTLLENGLRISLTLQHRPGGPTNGIYVSFDLGSKPKADDLVFRKIGDGNYDIG